MTEKTCRTCGTSKPRAQFYRNCKARDRLTGDCKDCHRELRRDYAKEEFQKKYATVHGRAYHLFNGARCRSRKRGLEFSLTVEWVVQRIEAGACEVTGLPFDFTKKLWAPSLDRVDPTKGYTPENTQVTVWIYNAAKNEGAHADVVRLAHALVS